MHEKICAIVPTYNRKDLLQQSLQSLCEQTRAVDKILVVDSASTDGTSAFVQKNFPQIEVQRLEENRGSAGGFHEGLKWAYGQGFDRIWFVDDDSRLAPDALEALLESSQTFLSKHGRRYVVVPVRLWSNDHSFAGLPALRYDFSNPFLLPEGRFGARVPISQFYRTYGSLPSFIYGEDFAWEGLLLPRAAVEDVGLPSAEYFTQREDTDYSQRLRQAGYAIILVPRSRIYRLIRPDPRGPMAAWKLRYIVRNQIWINRLYATNWPTRVLRSWLWAARYALPSLLKGRWIYDRPFFDACIAGAKEGLFQNPPVGERLSSSKEEGS